MCGSLLEYMKMILLKPYLVVSMKWVMHFIAPSLIRTDADEVTYNLHMAIRFELELDLLEGKLTVSEPAAWNQRYESDLGICPQSDRDGVMQDVHWYNGLIGG